MADEGEAGLDGKDGGVVGGGGERTAEKVSGR